MNLPSSFSNSLVMSESLTASSWTLSSRINHWCLSSVMEHSTRASWACLRSLLVWICWFLMSNNYKYKINICQTKGWSDDKRFEMSWLKILSKQWITNFLDEWINSHLILSLNFYELYCSSLLLYSAIASVFFNSDNILNQCPLSPVRKKQSFLRTIFRRMCPFLAAKLPRHV